MASLAIPTCGKRGRQVEASNDTGEPADEFDFYESGGSFAVYVSTDVAPHCYLFEALLWLAFRRFPLAFPTDEGGDVRWDNDFDDAVPSVEVDPASDGECERAGLPPSPEYAAFLAGDYISEPHNIEKLLSMNLEQADREKLETDLVASRVHYSACEAWERHFEQYLELHKARLFMALREGKIASAGKAIPTSASDDFPAELDADEWAAWARQKWRHIPSNNWQSTGIDWERSWSRGYSEDFALVLVPMKSLFEAFPPDPQPAGEAVQIGDAYLISGITAPAGGKRGRPSFDWDELHLELAKRVAANALPSKQEALIADMQAWCLKHWHRSVGRSTLLGKISPYYATFVR